MVAVAASIVGKYADADECMGGESWVWETVAGLLVDA